MYIRDLNFKQQTHAAFHGRTQTVHIHDTIYSNIFSRIIHCIRNVTVMFVKCIIYYIVLLSFMEINMLS